MWTSLLGTGLRQEEKSVLGASKLGARGWESRRSHVDVNYGTMCGNLVEQRIQCTRARIHSYRGCGLCSYVQMQI